MLIVVNAMFPMFSFCKLLYLYMFRCGAREAVRGVSCFPADRADLHRCRSGKANPTDRAQARQMPQMPFGVLLVFPQIAQICTDAVRGASCFPADCADLHRCRSGRFLFPADCVDADAVRVLLVFHTDCAVGAKV